MEASRITYGVGAVANFIIGRGLRSGHPPTHLTLQSLVYLGYAVSLSLFDRRLFNERIEAWDIGPVVPELFHEFKRFGKAPIEEWSIDFDHARRGFEIPLVKDEDTDALVALNMTWMRYANPGGPDPWQIACLPEGPWARTWGRGEERGVISDQMIREHFQGDRSR